MSTTHDSERAQRVAEAARDAMWAKDRACQALGMTVLSVGPGTATLAMRVREDMVNGHDICHGGLIATLADSAFAYACNAYNEATVASGFAIDLLAPGRLGDMLTASAVELSRGSRTGVYDIEVRNQDGVRIAVFRGRSYTMKGRHVADPATLSDAADPATLSDAADPAALPDTADPATLG